MKKSKIFILFFVFNFLWLNAQKPENELVTKLIDSAKKLKTLNKFTEAIDVYKSALLELDEQNSDHAIVAKIYSDIGDDYVRVRNIDSAKVYIDKGLNFLKARKIENSPEKGLLYYSLGTVHAIKGDLKNGEKYFNEALKVQLESIGENHYDTAATYGNLANVALYKRELDKATTYLNKAINITKNTLGENHQKMSGYYNNLGIVCTLKGELKRALINYENSIRITKNNHGSDFFELNQPYYNLSSMYHNLGYFDKAIDYLLKSIRLKEKIYTVKGYELGTAYTLLALQYSEIHKFEEAISSLEKGLELLKKTYGDNHQTIVMNYSNFCTVYRKMNKNNEAIKYGLKALAILKDLPNKDYFEMLSIYSNLSKAYINIKDYANAIKYSNKALTVLANGKGNDNNKADIYLNLAKTNILKNENSLQEKYLDSAVKCIGYDKVNPGKFIKINDLSVLSYYFELELLKYRNKLQSSKNQKYSDSIRITYDAFLNYQDFIYQKLSRRENKSFRIDQSHFLYEKSILNIIERKKTDELAIAFEEAEKVKSRLLLENLNKQNAQNFANIKDSLLAKEYDLEKKISQLEKKKFSLKGSDSLLNLVTNEIFEVKNKQDKLQEKIKKQHPDYYNLVYNQDVINVKDIQKLIQHDQSLVEYFVGEENIFIFLITKDKYIVKQVDKNFPIKKWIAQLREGIYNYWAMSNASDEDLEKYNALYKDMAFKLYQKFIQPIEELITDKVIIIPDGELNFVPFDALLTKNSSQINDSKALPYLLKKHQISYNYSATLFGQLKGKNKSKASNDVLAFAPKFTNDEKIETITMRRNGLGTLKYNTQEVEAISNLFNTNLFKNDLATKDNFILNVKDHKIIHLSTHAKSNDIQGDYSFIAFSQSNDSLSENQLYVRELYDLDLDADMVVLSACETGIGELKKGEGVISLARAFTYAGARSTITSLWNVNDAQTTKLMTLFYANLKQGMSKDKALHHAKLTYIENEELAAPYFWAAFIPAGDMEAIQFNESATKYYIIGAFLLIGLLGLGIYRKKKAA